MRLFGLPILLLALLPIGSCDPGILTQVIIHYRSNYLGETATLVRITTVREGLENVVVEKSMSGLNPQATFPLQVPLEPTGGDSTRRFRVTAEFEDATGNILHQRETIGGFEEGRRLEVVVRLDRDCGGMRACGTQQTCRMGACQAACVLPVEQEGRDETPSVSCARYRKPIQLAGFNVSTMVEALPVVVSIINDPDLAEQARRVSDDEGEPGGDIAFADTRGAALPHELISYDPDEGSLIAWVRIPEIRPGRETEFFMYFGGASAPVDDGAMWSGFAGVWHFDEDTNDEATRVAVDQSVHGTELTTRVARPSVDGVVHRAQEFPGRGSEEFPEEYTFGGGTEVQGLDFSAEESFTVSLWAKLTSGGYLIWRGSSDRPGFKLTEDRAALTALGSDGVDNHLVGPEGEDLDVDRLDEWTLVTLVVDRMSNRSTLYWNGVQGANWLSPDITGLGAPIPSSSYFMVGGTGGCCQIGGSLDEVWIERAASSRTRVRAMWHNQHDPPASIRVGELEALY